MKITTKKFRNLLQGVWVAGEGEKFKLLNKYSYKELEEIDSAGLSQIKRCVDVATKAFSTVSLSNYERGIIIEKAAQILAERSAEVVQTLQQEAGFTASDAQGELKRCLETLKLSAEEARKLSGEMIPLTGAPDQKNRIGFTVRVPLGIVAAITPFNAPLNTVTHKIAPAFAAGNAVILKPSTHTPLTACLLVQAFLDAGMPAGMLQVLQGGAEVAQGLLQDERVRFFAFTGSTEVGRQIQQAAGLRRTQMELGSIAHTIVCDDANLEQALPKIVNAGYRKAGQVCTSIQILLVHRSRFTEVCTKLAPAVAALKFGDPSAADTFVGPVISEASAQRIERWIQQAVAQGAKVLAGGSRQGSVIAPTLLADIAPDTPVGCQEVFGPVMSVVAFDDLDEAIERVNSTPYGLAAGIFTNRINDAFKAARLLQVGGVHVNETSSSRVDLMPYGGSKDSGFGREGPHHAVHEMTEERVVTLTLQ